MQNRIERLTPEAGAGAPLLSILIPALAKRSQFHAKLFPALLAQIARHAPCPVEVLVIMDAGMWSVGDKRNDLLGAARGEYTVFFDDDDLPAPDYVDAILKALESRPDLVSITNRTTFDGARPQLARITWGRPEMLQDPSGLKVVGDCCCHLCPVRREIAASVRFANQSFGEDKDWSRQVLAKVDRNKVVCIMHPIYFYLFSSTGTETQKHLYRRRR